MNTNDTAKNLAKSMLDAQKLVIDAAMAQSKIVEKQVTASFDATRQGVELSQNLTSNLTNAWIDAVTPAKSAPAAK